MSPSNIENSSIVPSVRVSNKDAALREKYYISNGVDAIIDEEMFTAVQEEKKRRSTYETTPEGKVRKGKKYSSKQPQTEATE